MNPINSFIFQSPLLIQFVHEFNDYELPMARLLPTGKPFMCLNRR
jgi:hypothetical protein